MMIIFAQVEFPFLSELAQCGVVGICLALIILLWKVINLNSGTYQTIALELAKFTVAITELKVGLKTLTKNVCRQRSIDKEEESSVQN